VVYDIVLTLLVGGFNPSEEYEFVSWDDEIPNMMGKSSHKVPWFQTTNQLINLNKHA
jgi:hypothetical protein